MKKLAQGFLGFYLVALLLVPYQMVAQERKVLPGISHPGFVEFAPAISGDGKTMVFQQMRKKRWYLFQSELLSSGTWSDPQPLEKINDRFRSITSGGASLSYDGKTLYFSAYEIVSDGVSSEDIFVTKNLHGTWSDPENLGKPINSFRYEGAPSISADGRTLYFMRENTDNAFDKDAKVDCFTLFRSDMDENGNWREPVPLPYPVNFNCERSPRIMVDGKTLLFSSVRANGKGGFDIYQSRLGYNGVWSEPVPLGFLNTPHNDQSPCMAPDGEKIYYYCDGDIYEAVIPKELREFDRIILYGRVIDAVYKLGLSVDLEIMDHFSKKVIRKFDNTESDGKFTITLSKGMKYDFNIIQDNFFTYTFLLDLSEYKTQVHLEKDFELFSNLNLKLDVVDIKTQVPIPYDERVVIRMDRTPREDIYLLKFQVKNYWEASTFLDLNEVRRDPDFRKRIELSSLY
jgi:YHS domain-containing protein